MKIRKHFKQLNRHRRRRALPDLLGHGDLYLNGTRLMTNCRIKLDIASAQK